MRDMLNEMSIFFRKLIPIFASALAAQVSSLINTVLTGNYSTLDLAAVSYGFIMAIMITSVSQGGIGAMVPFLQEMRSASKYEKGIVVSLKAAIMYMILSFLIFTTFYFGLEFLGYSVEYINKIRSYLLPMFVFLLALQFLSLLINVLIINDSIKVIGVFGITATVLDVTTSSIFVFGYKGIPGLGAQGAALGSMVGSLTVSFLALHFVIKNGLIDVKKVFREFKGEYFGQSFSLLKNTVSSGLSNLVGWLVAFTTIFAISHSTEAELLIGVNQVLNSMLSILLVLAACSVTLLSNELATLRINKKSIIHFFKSVVVGYLAVYIILVLFVGVFFDTIVAIYSSDLTLLDKITSVSGFVSVYVLISVLHFLFNAYFISLKNSVINFRSQVVSYLVFLLFIGTYIFIYNEFDLRIIWALICIERILQLVYKAVILKSKGSE